jgi:hypothetical protein
MAFPPLPGSETLRHFPHPPLVANDRVALPLHPPGSAPVLGFLLTLPKIDQRLDWTADKVQLRSRRLGQRRFRMS